MKFAISFRREFTVVVDAADLEELEEASRKITKDSIERFAEHARALWKVFPHSTTEDAKATYKVSQTRGIAAKPSGRPQGRPRKNAAASSDAGAEAQFDD